jgi:hypothetical protein
MRRKRVSMIRRITCSNPSYHGYPFSSHVRLMVVSWSSHGQYCERTSPYHNQSHFYYLYYYYYTAFIYTSHILFYSYIFYYTQSSHTNKINYYFYDTARFGESVCTIKFYSNFLLHAIQSHE